MSNEIINKVTQSPIFTYDMEHVLPKKNEVILFDLKPFLWQEIALKEKDFRLALKALDWQKFHKKAVLVSCTADAIIPIWAYMLVITYLAQVEAIGATTEQAVYVDFLTHDLEKTIAEEKLKDRPVVIKGCSNIPFKEELYLQATKLLVTNSKSIMYGEPCSTVPIYKRK
jgi:Protein of unknown function (DUF2480)